MLTDKVGNRRSFISWGYAIWGVTVALFGCISEKNIGVIVGSEVADLLTLTLGIAVIGDCIMTAFGSLANDAAFNAWVTDNTKPAYRGTVEGVLSILPLIAMLIVAGGFGIVANQFGYQALFIGLGVVISLAGVLGLIFLKDAPTLEKNGGFRDIFYGFKPSVIAGNKRLYLTLVAVLVYGIACQIFMPYLIIYMTTYLGFNEIEYSVVFGGAILLGAGVNLYLTRLSDRMNKLKLLYVASGIFALGLFGMYLSSFIPSFMPLLITFGISGFVMIVGFIFISALCGSTVRDYTPKDSVGRLQGVRMVFSVLIPMLAGPAIGNAINRFRGVKLPSLDTPDAMTTEFIPAPEIFLAAAACALLLFAVIPFISRVMDSDEKK